MKTQEINSKFTVNFIFLYYFHVSYARALNLNLEWKQTGTRTKFNTKKLNCLFF